MEKRWDVLGVGCAAVDDLLYVMAYPPADAKVPVERSERHCGGLTATALVAAARQGARCAYAGALGDDELSAFVLAALAKEGVDVSAVPRHPGAGPFHSTIIVDQTAHTRNIFFRQPQVVGPTAAASTAEQVRAARVVLIDHYGGAATVRVQEAAKAAGVPVVADLERDDVPEFAGILSRCEHLIVSDRFARRLARCDSPEAAAAALWGPARAAVVVTCGASGCWAVGRGQARARHYDAFPVDAVDTTGCGDTFHGVYAAELAHGADLAQCTRRASAAAAIKATRRGGQQGIPGRQEVDQFLAARS